MKPGDRVSVWLRDSRRHKWRMEMSDVRVLHVDGDSVVVQKGTERERDGPTSFFLRGDGTWERELRKPVLFPVSK